MKQHPANDDEQNRPYRGPERRQTSIPVSVDRRKPRLDDVVRSIIEQDRERQRDKERKIGN